MEIISGVTTEYGHDVLGLLLGPSVTVRITPRRGDPFIVSLPAAIAHALWLDTEDIASVLIFHGNLIDVWGGSV